jgi:hypothetical protein
VQIYISGMPAEFPVAVGTATVAQSQARHS